MKIWNNGNLGGFWGGIFSAIAHGAKYAANSGKHRNGHQPSRDFKEKRRAAQKRARLARAKGRRS